MRSFLKAASVFAAMLLIFAVLLPFDRASLFDSLVDTSAALSETSVTGDSDASCEVPVTVLARPSDDVLDVPAGALKSLSLRPQNNAAALPETEGSGSDVETVSDTDIAFELSEAEPCSGEAEFSESVDEDDDNDIRLCGYGHSNIVSVYDNNGDLCDTFTVGIYDFENNKINYADGKRFMHDLYNICAGYDYDGIPLYAMMAQAYTEGGCGKQGVYRQSNNLFGMRAGPQWDGYVYARDLGRTFASYSDAKANGSNDMFRAYKTPEESVKDYIVLIHTSALYKNALGKDTKAYLTELTKAGYGSKSMVEVWLSVIRTYKLAETYDSGEN